MNNQDTWWSRMLRFSMRSDIGMRRSNNQDSSCAFPANSARLWKSRGHLFIVADGMGAHAAGELASHMATEIISQSYLKRTEESPPLAIQNAVYQAHEQIKRQGTTDDAFHDMGTTVDALLILPEGAYVAHVGDSRVYRLRNDVYEQLTFDHSLVWEIRHSGKVPLEKIPNFIPKNVITRSLGPTENLVVDLEGPHPLQIGDTFLLCSDGLSGQVDDTEMGQILELFEPEEATESLINLANLRGGPDNVTVLVAKVTTIPQPEEKKEDAYYEKRRSFSTSTWLFLTFAIASLLAVFLAGFFGVRSENLAQKSICLKTAAGFGVIGGIFLALFFWKVHKRQHHAKISSNDHTRKGPYVRVSALPNKLFCDRLNEIIGHLKRAVFDQNLNVHWDVAQKHLDQADLSMRRYNYGESIRLYFRAINYIMNELKKKHKSF